MLRLALSAAFVITCTSAALAADLPVRRVTPVYIQPPAFTWTGYYAGVNLGADFSGNTDYTLFGNSRATSAAIAAGLRAPYLKTGSNGFAGGAQIGYNYQFQNGLLGFNSPVTRNFVLGIEADVDGLTNSASAQYTGSTGALSLYSSKETYVGTVRARLGYAVDKVLVFGTAGFAYGGVNDGLTTYNAAGVNDFAGRTRSVQTGYAYGGGIEYAVPTASFVNVLNASAVTVKAEFIHYNLLGAPGVVIASTLGSSNSYTARIHNDGNLARIGVNYKFDPQAAAPVVARY